MLTIRDAVRIEKQLMSAFLHVHIDGTREKPVVVARGHFKGLVPQPCQHRLITIARNVKAIIGLDTCLASGDGAIRYDKIVHCTKCELVFSAVRGYH